MVIMRVIHSSLNGMWPAHALLHCELDLALKRGSWTQLSGMHDVVSISLQVGPADDNPSKEEIERLHSLLCAEMIATFDSQKHAFGWHERTLEIL